MIEKYDFNTILDGTIESYKNDRITELGAYAFSGCYKLKSVDLPNVTSAYYSCFENCRSLVHVNLPKLKDAGSNMFSGCSSLKRVDMYDAYGNTGELHISNVFSYNPSLEIFALHVDKLETLTIDPFNNRDTKCKIYVPDDLVDQYKTAEYWSKHADRILGLSALPPDTV